MKSDREGPRPFGRNPSPGGLCPPFTMATLRCCVCGRPFEPDDTPALPFCSRRCQQIDLARWLDEQYGLPYESREKSEDSGARDPGAGTGE